MTYDRMTTEEFDQCLLQVLADMSTDQWLAIPGIYEIVSEAKNNEVLDQWAANREGQAEDHELTVCEECSAFINPLLPDDVHGAGTLEDPRAPGDHDTICDECEAEASPLLPDFEYRACDAEGHHVARSTQLDEVRGQGESIVMVHHDHPWK